MNNESSKKKNFEKKKPDKIYKGRMKDEKQDNKIMRKAKEYQYYHYHKESEEE